MNANKVPIVYVVTDESGDKIKVFGEKITSMIYANAIPNSGSYELQMQSIRSLKDWLTQQRIRGIPIDRELEWSL